MTFFQKLVESENKRGQRLLQELYKLERHFSLTSKNQKFQLPVYKHYTQFIHELLELNRVLGIPMRQALLSLKNHLKKEQQFSRQWESVRSGGVAQILLLFVVSWIFFETSRRILEQDFQLFFSLMLFLIQLAGLMVYSFFLRIFTNKNFMPLQLLEKVLLQLYVLKTSGLSSHKILSLAKLEQLNLVNDSQKDLKDQLTALVVAWRESGAQLESECLGLMEEVEFRQELARQKALVLEKALRFLVFALFFVVPYFLYLGGLMTSLFH